MSDETNVVFNDPSVRLRESKALSPESSFEKWLIRKTGFSLNTLRWFLVFISFLFFVLAIVIFFLAYYRLSL
ncbi:MAG: hypothetical protein WC629_01355 [Candidatus Paceibacterota bacterium]|jgi:hypothetical protein